MTESSSEGQEVPMAGARTEDGKVLIVGPDGMAVEGPPRSDRDDEQDDDEPRSVTELVEELERLTLDFTDDTVPTEAELRIAQAQLVGWLEGVFHGIQTALFAQQMAARQQLEQMRRALPGGQHLPDGQFPEAPQAGTTDGPGSGGMYL